MARQPVRIKNVGWRTHPTRKHGVDRDKHFYLRHTVNGREHKEYVGWATDDWTLEDVVALKKQLFENKKTGEGWQTLAEKREQEEDQRQEEAARKRKNKRDATTVAQVWSDYFEQAKTEKVSANREEQLYRLWIKPVIGDMRLKDVRPLHLEKIKKIMAEAPPAIRGKKKPGQKPPKGKKGRSARSAHYALAVVRQLFNYALRHGLFVGDNPVSRVKKPTSDNRRLRFLSSSEADRLLQELATYSMDVHDMALLALHCGLRFGEIASLTWRDVDIDKGLLVLRDTKNTRTRHAFLTKATRNMLEYRSTEEKILDKLVFPSATGGKIERVSNSFDKAVNNLGLNKAVNDPRQKVVFHTLRHTFASWLVESGVDLFTVKELLGHRTIAMTERYSHLGRNSLQEAVNRLDRAMEKQGKVIELQRQDTA